MREREYGSFSLRFFAHIFDQCLLWLTPLFLFSLVVSSSDTTAKFGLGILWVIWEIIFLQWIISWGYFIFTFILFRTSFGKILAGLSIEREDGGKSTLTDALMRFPIGYTVSGIFWWVGFLWIIKDPKKKGFHDHFAGTVVVRTGPSWPIMIFLPLMIFVIGLMIFLIINGGINNGLWTAVGKDLSDLYQVLTNMFQSGPGEKI
jgi:uncharacterized RDD family membrane protein YckC